MLLSCKHDILVTLRPSCAVEGQRREYLQNDSNKILALFKVISVDWVDLRPDGGCAESSVCNGHEILHAQKRIFLLVQNGKVQLQPKRALCVSICTFVPVKQVKRVPKYAHCVDLSIHLSLLSISNISNAADILLAGNSICTCTCRDRLHIALPAEKSTPRVT